MKSRFDEEMDRLHILMLEMGARCEWAIASGIKALLEKDTTCAEKALELEEEINGRERDIEALCLKLLLRWQPVAKDLRRISAALKMITDMERVGDQAADIAEIASLGNIHADGLLPVIREMAVGAIHMVTNAIDAYVRQDICLARQVVAADDEIDALFDAAKRELSLVLITEPKRGEAVIDLLMAAKYLERIADHAVNIAGWVTFSVTGRHTKAQNQNALKGSQA